MTEKEVTVEELIQYSSTDKKKSSVTGFASGILSDQVFYHIIFGEYNGTYHPVCVTSGGEMLQVHNNELELLKKGYKKKEIGNDQRYYFFKYGPLKCKIIQPLIFKDRFNIFTVDNRVLSYVKRMYFLSKGDLYEMGLSLINEYWDHFNHYEYDIALAFSIQSYFLRALGKTFNYLPDGKKATGKSTIQRVIARLQFNGFFGGKGTVAQSCRLTHCLSVNINQDEFDKLNREEKQSFIGMANNGLYSDGTYGITNTNRKRIEDQIEIFWTFSQRSFSTNKLSGFDDTFLSRCYICTCVPNNRPVKDILDLSVAERERFQDFRNQCFMYCLFNWYKLKNCIIGVKKELEEQGVFGRKTDMYSIILGIIKYFKGDYYQEIKRHLMDKDEVSQKENWDTYESIIFDYIGSLFFEERNAVEVSNKELIQVICDELGIDPSDKEKRPYPKRIGAILRNHHLLNKPENIGRRGEKGSTSYVLSRGEFMDMLRRFRYGDVISKMENLPSNSSNASNASKLFEGNEANEGNEDNIILDLIPLQPNLITLDELMDRFDYHGDEDDYKTRKKYVKEKCKELAEEGIIRVCNNNFTEFTRPAANSGGVAG